MNLQQVRVQHHHRDLNVRCYSCAKWIPLGTANADLDGPPFLAYYCVVCTDIHSQISAQTPADIRRPDCETERVENHY